MNALVAVEPYVFDVSLALLLSGVKPTRLYDAAIVCDENGCIGARRATMLFLDVEPWDPGVALSVIAIGFSVEPSVAELLAPIVDYDVVPVVPVVYTSREYIVVSAVGRFEYRLPPGCWLDAPRGRYTPGYIASRLRGSCHGLDRLLARLDGVRRSVKPKARRPGKATVLGVVWGRLSQSHRLPRFVYAVRRGAYTVLVHSPSEAEAERVATEFCTGIGNC